MFSIVISVIGTKEYLNIEQKQEQKQSITLNINGQAYSVQTEDKEEFNDVIEKQEYENNELQNVNASLSEQNEKVVVDEAIKNDNYLMEICPPYEKPLNLSTEPFKMQGEIYSNGFSIYTSEYRDILFNLQGAYSSLEFDFGHVDNSGDYMCNVNFYVDGILIKSISKNAQDNITHEIIELDYGKILKIEVLTKEKPSASAFCATYGFSNMILKN